MRFEAKSSVWSMLFHGYKKHILIPWHIIVDTDQEVIIVRKRNWYLIGVDEEMMYFRLIRRINIDRHLIGADIEIKALGGSIKAFCLSKNDCNRIKQIFLEYNAAKCGNDEVVVS
jgi:hypothetical protein